MGLTARKINLQENYLQTVHSNSKGWITKATINPTFSQWHYRYSDLIELDLKEKNVYITLNTFYKTFRRLECIKELKAQYIDLDTYKTGFTKTQILMHLEADFFDIKIPRPNFVIDSGRGLYLIWLINAVPYMALPLWQAVEEYFYKQLKQFGADRQALDATRVLRVPGSVNSKSNTIVKILEDYNYKYDLREIQHEFLPELTKRKKKGRPKKIVHVHRERSLYLSRIKDLTKLCELRNYDLKGHRELILFLYRYYLCAFTEDTEKALQDVLELNSMFKQPLKEKEAINATKSAQTCYLKEKKQYKYKNATLIDLLEITEEEQMQLSTIIGKEEYKRRDKIYQQQKYKDKLKNQGKITEKQKIEFRREKIKDLVAKGLKQKDICILLKISKRTCIRDIKFIKNKE